MKLNLRAMAYTLGILWAACFFLVGLGNLIWPSYGEGFLTLGASIYPGYHGPGGFGSVIVVTLYAALDGLVCGALIAWVYNMFAGGGQSA